MCGIAGAWWSSAPVNIEDRLSNAIRCMATRGPNHSAVDSRNLNGGVLSLLHTRLSIIDLTDSANQPMHTIDGRFSIVFNGEIYNYLELKKELSDAGQKFRTNSDTEVLLIAWKMWGEDCLKFLKGMFAFVIYDSITDKLICVRDGFGIKPFFYCCERDSFVFASDIRSITELRFGKKHLNWQRAYDYLVHGDYDSKEDSFLVDIKHLMPGHILELDVKSNTILKNHRWWQPNTTENKNLTFQDAAESLRERFLDNIKLHLRSDVPLGSALSGGVDSSSVVCAIRHIEPDVPIHTFSYIAKDSLVSEEQWVDKINDYVSAIPHKVIVNAKELVRDLDEMIIAQGEPFGSTSIYAQYRVFKLAKENGITVTLDGQGADELLGGYRGYPGKRIKSLLDDNKIIESLKFLHQWSKWPDRTLSHGIKLSIAEFADSNLYQFLRNLNGDTTTPLWLNKKILEEAGVSLSYPNRYPEIKLLGRNLISELSYSLTTRGLPALLRHADRNSMHFSVESRVPFLTNDLADFTLSLPESYLVSSRGETKHIFRAAMRGIVPDEVLDRKDKIGFETPEKDWLLGMSDTIESWLNEDLKIPFLNQSEIIKEFNMVKLGKRKFNWQVWRWINFIRWYQLYMY